jgi:hypothetical protein
MPEANFPALAEDTGYGAGRVAAALKEGTATLARSPDNKIRPTVRALADVAGGAAGGMAGHLTGNPEVTMAGTVLGGAAADRLTGALPKRTITPETAAAQLKQRVTEIAARKVAQRDADIAAGLRKPVAPNEPAPKVTAKDLMEEPTTIIVRAPREPMPGEKPGTTFSAKRANLQGMAERGDPQAAQRLREQGNTVLFTPPEGTDYPGPRANTSEVAPEKVAQSVTNNVQSQYKTRVGRNFSEGVPPEIEKIMKAAGMKPGSHYMPGTDLMGPAFNEPGDTSISFKAGQPVTTETLRAKMGTGVKARGTTPDYLAQKSSGSNLVDVQREVNSLGMSDVVTPSEAHLLAREFAKPEYQNMTPLVKQRLVRSRMSIYGGK